MHTGKLLTLRHDEHVLEINHLRRHAARQAPWSARCPRQGDRVSDRVCGQGEREGEGDENEAVHRGSPRRHSFSFGPSSFL